MDLLEHEAKRLLARAGIPVPEGFVCLSPVEAANAAERLRSTVAVKAQVPIGGRGRAGGVRLVGGPSTAYEAASQILGMEIGGYRVEQVLVEEAVLTEREFYAALVLDRGAKAVVAMLSKAGGMNVETTAGDEERSLASAIVPPLIGWKAYLARQLVSASGVERTLSAAVSDVLSRMWQVLC